MSSKQELNRKISEVQQEYIASAVLTNDKIAHSVGLHAVDLQTLGVILRKGKAMTPSEVSEATQLPLSSTTRVLDQLENRQLIQRKNDTTDRRRILITVDEKGFTKLGNPWKPIATMIADIHKNQFSEQELQTILRYFTVVLDAKIELENKKGH